MLQEYGTYYIYTAFKMVTVRFKTTIKQLLQNFLFSPEFLINFLSCTITEKKHIALLQHPVQTYTYTNVQVIIQETNNVLWLWWWYISDKSCSHTRHGTITIHLNIVICIVLQYSNPWHYISHRRSLNNYKTIFIFYAYNIVGRLTLLPIIMYHEYDRLY